MRAIGFVPIARSAAVQPRPSETTVAQPVKQLVAITRTTSRRLQQSALDFIDLLHGFNAFCHTTDALVGAADQLKEQNDGEPDGPIAKCGLRPWMAAIPPRMLAIVSAPVSIHQGGRRS